MQTIFSRSPWERKLGQSYSWNGWGDQSGHDFTTNPYGGMTPEQRLLKNAQESMQAPRPLTPEQQMMRNNGFNLGPGGEIAADQDCYTCSNGSDIKNGVSAAVAATLRSQGYRCRKDECAQQQQGGYGQMPVNFPNWSSLTSSGPVSSMVSDVGQGNYGGYAMIAGPLRVVNG